MLRPLRFAALPLLLVLAQCGAVVDETARAPRSLFDRPLAAVSRPGPDPTTTVGMLRETETVWFLEQRFSPWQFFATAKSRDGWYLWRGVPSLPVLDGGVVTTVAALGAATPRASFTASEGPVDISSLEIGDVAVDDRGVHTVTRSAADKPGPLRPCYPTRSSAVLDRLAPTLPEPGGTLEPTELSMADETRRALRVESGTSLGWTPLADDAGARLRFGYGLQTATARHRKDTVELIPKARAGARFSVVWQAPGVEARELWSATLGPEQAGVIHDGAVDGLPPFTEGAVLSLRVEAEQETKSAPDSAHPVWFEPSLRSRSGSEDERRPNVLLIVLDTLRADRLSCYGYDRRTSPNLDAFAAEGALYEDVWSSAPWTLPSHASLLTSLHASEHGVFDAGTRLSEEARTVAEVLWDAGYETAAFTESGYVRPEVGLAQGFERFRLHLGDVAETLADAADWIEERPRPFFAFVQTYKVHAPYDPEGDARERFVRPYDGALPTDMLIGAVPDPHDDVRIDAADTRYISDLYDAEIAELDEALGAFFDRLRSSGVLEHTLVIVTSDHGEEFGEHGQFGHGNSLYQEQLAVPLILRAPRRIAGGAFTGGRRVTRPVLGIDVAPTIARAAGAPVPQAWSGTPLTDEVRRKKHPLWVPFQPEGTGTFAVAVRRGDRKFISYPSALRPQDSNSDSLLFDLSGDARERSDLWPAAKADHRVWRQVVDQMRAEYPTTTPGEAVLSNPEIRAQLAALGYATSDD